MGKVSSAKTQATLTFVLFLASRTLWQKLCNLSPSRLQPCPPWRWHFSSLENVVNFASVNET
jgi:hypothetical protein